MLSGTVKIQSGLGYKSSQVRVQVQVQQNGLKSGLKSGLNTKYKQYAINIKQQLKINTHSN